MILVALLLFASGVIGIHVGCGGWVSHRFA